MTTPNHTTRLPVVFHCGFRPFFFLGPLYAVFILIYWVGFLAGKFSAVPTPFSTLYWHEHEMFLGFAGAIIAGFLLTAVQNWTKQTTLSPPGILLISLLWILGRFAMFFGNNLPFPLLAFLDTSYLLVLLYGVSKPILKSRNKRNYFVPVLVGLLLLFNLGFHAYLVTLQGPGPQYYLNSLMSVIILFLVIFADRVIPFFTSSAIPDLLVKRFQKIELLSLVFCALWALCFFLNQPQPFTGVISLLAGAFLLIKMIPWKPFHCLKNPMLWILHLGHLCLAIGFFFDGLIQFQVLPFRSLGVHTFTAGALSLLILGMISRVSLGHTGRKIQSDLWILTSFVFMVFALIFRVILPLSIKTQYMLWMKISGFLWVFAFLIFIFRYTPILFSPRPDGKFG